MRPSARARDDTHRRTVSLIGAASSIGIRPYADGTRPRRLDEAPGVLRRHGIVAALAAEDLGDVVAPPYRDFVRPPNGIRNEGDVASYSLALADRIEPALGPGRFAVVLGGDCSIILGSMLAARRRFGRVGLAYVDAHADFGTPEESVTGSAASMCLALAVGRGDSALARLAGTEPLVRGDDVALVGRRDVGQDYYGHGAIESSGLLDLPDSEVTEGGRARASALLVGRLGREALDGFWIHVDADVLNPSVMPAVDSPEPGGPDIDQLAALLRPLVEHPAAIGMQLTIYDPGLDPDLTCARRIVGLLGGLLGSGPAATT